MVPARCEGFRLLWALKPGRPLKLLQKSSQRQTGGARITRMADPAGSTYKGVAVPPAHKACTPCFGVWYPQTPADAARKELPHPRPSAARQALTPWPLQPPARVARAGLQGSHIKFKNSGGYAVAAGPPKARNIGFAVERSAFLRDQTFMLQQHAGHG